ncbi:MAG: Glutaryl-7-aminocephalosporanic-acid acylase [Flavobacteriaceae bacterium]|nr:MAG: Glutaryl-7-aminocephalosporanic-acid acylase [Flavobacteriaceae bacterium]
MKQIGLLLFFLVLSACTSSEELSRLEARAERVEIIRDDFGVPHIYAETDADAVFGMLYAQCEDDFNRVEQNYIWATGRLAEAEGATALYSDLRAQLFMTEDEAKAAFEESPDWLKELCVAFADGVNYYLETHPEVEPRVIKHFEPWMPYYFSEGSIGGDIERVSTRKIKAFYGDQRPIDFIESEAIAAEVALLEPAGSNGIALNSQKTKSGNAMLLINPHTSFFFRGEMHVVSEEGLNAYGAVTWGQFFIYQGFNEKTGWMHTSTYTDVIDEFVEEVRKTANGLEYRYGTQWRPVKSFDTTLKVRSDDGSLVEQTFTLYRTYHGPVTHQLDDNWVSTAMMWSPARALEQSFIRTKQNGYEGFSNMMNLKTNSSNNTVYADAEGNIAYWHGNFIPKRNMRFDYAQPVDGTNPETDWQGLHEVSEHITLLNPSTGWLQNCNSTPFTLAGDDSPKPEDYPYYMSTAPENFRGIHAIRLLANEQKHDLQSLIQLAYDPSLPAFEVLIPGLIDAYDRFPDPELSPIIDALRSWDFKTNLDSEAMSIAHFYGTRLLREIKRPNGYSELEHLTFWGSSESDPKKKLALLSATVEQMTADFGTPLIAWGEVNRYQRIDGSIYQAFSDSLPSIAIPHASGRWGALAAYGARYHNNTKKIYGTRGNSFVAVVEFGDKVEAYSLLAGGQSGDPSSKHFDDQTSLYVDGAFKKVPFYKEEVLRRAIETYHPGERY